MTNKRMTDERLAKLEAYEKQCREEGYFTGYFPELLQALKAERERVEELEAARHQHIQDKRISELEAEVNRLEYVDKKWGEVYDNSALCYHELQRKYEALVEIKTLLEQMIDMNGAEYFWKHLSRMPISKFNGPLRTLLEDDDEA